MGEFQTLPSWARMPLRPSITLPSHKIDHTPHASFSIASDSPQPRQRICSSRDISFLQEQHRATIQAMQSEIEALKSENRGAYTRVLCVYYAAVRFEKIGLLVCLFVLFHLSSTELKFKIVMLHSAPSMVFL